MVRKLLLVLSLFLTVKIHSVNSNEFTNSHVNLTVFYQSQCLDSAKFFEEQLKPAVAELLSRRNGINLELVPYGRANSTKIGGNITFSCEHGEEECEGNRFHACIADQGQGNVQMMLNMATCMFDRFSLDTPAKHASSCCDKSEYFYDYEVLWVCATGSTGALLLYNNGLLTAKWNPYFMPTIVLNGDAGDDEFQNQLKTNLLPTVLKSLAEAAASTTNSTSATINATQKAHLYKWAPPKSKASANSADPIHLISLVLSTVRCLYFVNPRNT